MNNGLRLLDAKWNGNVCGQRVTDESSASKADLMKRPHHPDHQQRLSKGVGGFCWGGVFACMAPSCNKPPET